jgi:hypothetical protein
MNNYRIAPAEHDFQVIESLPDGGKRVMGGFPTEADARGWLDSFMILIGLIDCMPPESSRL